MSALISLLQPLLAWVLKQKKDTVLLFLLLVGFGVGIGLVVHQMRTLIPAAIGQVQAGYQKIEDANAAQLLLIRDEFRADQERDQQLIERLLAPCPFPERSLTEKSHAVDGPAASP